MDLLQVLFTFVKGRSQKYIRRISTGNPERPYRYIYEDDNDAGQGNDDYQATKADTQNVFQEGLSKVLSFFGVKSSGKEAEKKADSIVSNVAAELSKVVPNVSPTSFKEHMLEYFAHKEAWDKYFQSKEKANPMKTKPEKSESKDTEKETKEKSESNKEKSQAQTVTFKDRAYRVSVMKFLYDKYKGQTRSPEELKENGVPDPANPPVLNQENKPVSNSKNDREKFLEEVATNPKARAQDFDEKTQTVLNPMTGKRQKISALKSDYISKVLPNLEKVDGKYQEKKTDTENKEMAQDVMDAIREHLYKSKNGQEFINKIKTELAYLDDDSEKKEYFKQLGISPGSDLLLLLGKYYKDNNKDAKEFKIAKTKDDKKLIESLKQNKESNTLDDIILNASDNLKNKSSDESKTKELLKEKANSLTKENFIKWVVDQYFKDANTLEKQMSVFSKLSYSLGYKDAKNVDQLYDAIKSEGNLEKIPESESTTKAQAISNIEKKIEEIKGNASMDNMFAMKSNIGKINSLIAEANFHKSRKGEQRADHTYYRRVETGNPKNPYNYYYTKEAFDADHPKEYEGVIGSFKSLFDKGKSIFTKKNVVKSDIDERVNSDYSKVSPTTALDTFKDHWLYYWKNKSKFDEYFSKKQTKSPEGTQVKSPEVTTEKVISKTEVKQGVKPEEKVKPKYNINLLKSIHGLYSDLTAKPENKNIEQEATNGLINTSISGNTKGSEGIQSATPLRPRVDIQQSIGYVQKEQPTRDTGKNVEQRIDTGVGLGRDVRRVNVGDIYTSPSGYKFKVLGFERGMVRREWLEHPTLKGQQGLVQEKIITNLNLPKEQDPNALANAMMGNDNAKKDFESIKNQIIEKKPTKSTLAELNKAIYENKGNLPIEQVSDLRDLAGLINHEIRKPSERRRSIKELANIDMNKIIQEQGGVGFEKIVVTLEEKNEAKAVDNIDKAIEKISIKKQHDINEKVKALLASKSTGFTDEEKALLERYEGQGGQTTNKNNDYIGKGLLYEFYTPQPVVDKVFDFVSQYLQPGANILEPSAGTGRFAKGRDDKFKFDMLEIDDTSSKIAQILRPNASVSKKPFETMFLDNRNRSVKEYKGKKYDASVGNPPYGKMTGLYKSTEGKGWDRYEEYFIHRSLDTLNEGGVLAMVVPSSFLKKGMTGNKKTIFDKCELLDAYRLPEGAFGNTQIGTDVIILRKNTTGTQDNKHAFNDDFFSENPDKVIGETKERKNKFGKLETYVEGNIDKFLSMPIEKKEMSQAQKDAIAKGLVGNDNAKKDIQAENKKQVKTSKVKKELMDKVKEISSGVPSTHDVYSQAEFNKTYNKNFDDLDLKILNNLDSLGFIKSFDGIPNDWNKISYVDGKYQPNYLYAAGNINDKLAQLEKDKDNIIEAHGIELYNKQKALLEKSKPKNISIDKISLTPIESFARGMVFEDGKSLQDKFLEYVQGVKKVRTGYVRRGQSTITFEGGLSDDFFAGYTCRRDDIVQYIQGERVTGRDAEENATRRKERKTLGNKLFNQYISENLTTDERTQLESKWNETFNNNTKLDSKNIPVLVDGLSKTFKGKKLEIKDVQMQYVARWMSKGVGCATHQVGVGKTMTGIIATVSNMQAGNCKKPVVVVPTSVLQKWGKEFEGLFPGVPYKVVGTPELNKMTDGKPFEVEPGTVTIMSYDAFEQFGFSEEKFQELTSEVKDQIENPNADSKRGKSQEGELAEGFAGVSKVGTRDSLQFDKAGFDHITVDEAHNFNNIFVDKRTYKGGKGETPPGAKDEEETSTANEYEGITGGTPSNRGIKLWLASRHILKENKNRNVLLLTATPFTNNPLQVYSLLSMVAKEKLEAMGIRNVRDFIGAFVETQFENVMEGNGQIKNKQTVRSFKNAHAFQKLVSEYFEYKTGEDAGIERPKLHQKSVILPMTTEMEQTRNSLEALYDAKDEKGNALPGASLQSITNQQILNISPSLVKNDFSNPSKPKPNPNYGKNIVESSPKLKFALDSIGKFYKEFPNASSMPTPGQVMFMPRGVEFLQECKDYLVKKYGIDPETIQLMRPKEKQDKAKDKEKAAQGVSRFTEITDDFNNENGKCKIIIGSDVIKEGVDLNGNTAICYNTMTAWNPTDEQQKLGRAWRQGNKQKEVHFVNIQVENSIDTKLFQKQAEKSSRINEIFSDTGTDIIDIADINPDELKLDVIRDPKRKAKFKIEQEVADLRTKKREIQGKLARVSSALEDYDKATANLKSEEEYLSEKEKELEETIIKEKAGALDRWDDTSEEISQRIRDTKKDIREIKYKIQRAEMILERNSMTPEKAKRFVEKSEKDIKSMEGLIFDISTNKRNEYEEKFAKELADVQKNKVKQTVDQITNEHVQDMLLKVTGKKVMVKSRLTYLINYNRVMNNINKMLKTG